MSGAEGGQPGKKIIDRHDCMERLDTIEQHRQHHVGGHSRLLVR